MFNVKHNECVGFESRWKVKKVSSVVEAQTTQYATLDSGTGTAECRSIETQTDAVQSQVSSEADDAKLAEWLKRIYPKVKKELDDAVNSKAFRGYRLQSDKTDVNCKLLQVLEVDDKERVSSISWNSASRTVAVACAHNHRFWCYHEGFVKFYTLGKDDTLKETGKKINTEFCVEVVQFHVEHPFVIAAGLFSGDILIWNTESEEEMCLAKVSGHENAITQLTWIPEAASNIVLGSSSLDGIMKLWDFNISASPSLKIKQIYKIKAPILGRMPGNKTEINKKVLRGVKCFSFSKHVPDMFVVGAEGGLIAQCSTFGATQLKSTGDEPTFDPVFQYYVPHEGEIRCVSFSPNRKEMFMTCGADGEIRIYIVGQEEPAQVIFQKLNCVCWIPFQENIIAGGGTGGVMNIIRLQNCKQIPDITKEKPPPAVLTRMEINKRVPGFVVIGTHDGSIQLWNVPWTSFNSMIL